MMAEFGTFILPEFQNKGHGREALLQLLTMGFCEMGLRTIYSDCLDYPGENRFLYYEKLGFVAHPKETQDVRYKKQGIWVPSIKFYMTKEMFDTKHGDRANKGKLEAWGKAAAYTRKLLAKPMAQTASKGIGLHPSQANVNPAA